MPIVYLDTEFDKRSAVIQKQMQRRFKSIDEDDHIENKEAMQLLKSFILNEATESKPRQKRAAKGEELPNLDLKLKQSSNQMEYSLCIGVNE